MPTLLMTQLIDIPILGIFLNMQVDQSRREVENRNVLFYHHVKLNTLHLQKRQERQYVFRIFYLKFFRRKIKLQLMETIKAL